MYLHDFGTICMAGLIDFSATFDGKLELNEVSFEPIARERESGGLSQQGRWIRNFHPRFVCLPSFQ
jgi:hypothetical protein